jgi:hypothetical protein
MLRAWLLLGWLLCLQLLLLQLQDPQLGQAVVCCDLLYLLFLLALQLSVLGTQQGY